MMFFSNKYTTYPANLLSGVVRSKNELPPLPIAIGIGGVRGGQGGRGLRD